MKNKIISILTVVAIIFSLPVWAFAEGSYTVTAPQNGILYVNGEMSTGEAFVTENDSLYFTAEDAIIIFAGNSFYLPDEPFTVSTDTDFSDATPIYKTGLAMVNGAQVRVGQVELDEEGKLDATVDSGLRFIATADYNDTLIAQSDVEFGIKVGAEGSDNKVYIPAEKFQNDDNSVFSAAITKLATNNYNRKYVANAYAKVTLHDGSEVEFTDGEVARSIYQVSVGILKNSSAEADSNLPYTIDDAVKNVLNAYINQTGIRLLYKTDGSMSASDAYTGDLFFDVAYEVVGNSTKVVITPLGEATGFANEVEIASWWKEYIRVNNNNSVASTYISDAKLENGALSFTFTIPGDYTFNQDSSVTVVSSVTDTEIKGFKAGSAVTYTLADNVTVLGLSKSMEDIVPGCVILEGYNSAGEVSAVELLASLGLPIDTAVFENSFGVYNAADGSTKYKNVVTEMYSKSGTKLTCQSLPDTTKTAYQFETGNSMCYRVGIAMDGETPVVTVNAGKVGAYPSIFESTATYHNYLYFRYDSETERVKECVYYCVPKDLDFSGDGEYSDIFSLSDYQVIIK